MLMFLTWLAFSILVGLAAGVAMAAAASHCTGRISSRRRWNCPKSPARRKPASESHKPERLRAGARQRCET